MKLVVKVVENKSQLCDKSSSSIIFLLPDLG